MSIYVICRLIGQINFESDFLTFVILKSSMGQTTSRIEQARTKHKSKPRSSKSIEEKKIKLAQTTGVLALTDSKLKEIPISIISNGDLQEKLRSLDLSRNQITRVPTEMNTVRFSNMKSLKLQSNAIHSLPDLSQLMALTKVHSRLRFIIPT
ncbi:unnamed protein product [Albugo candida]|uniref:Uncharacterized protein n=1 Tax=Albugo candida TaxID=65357 RepID=A0A024GKU3_9STRA|nr:unnamed protein product [Albugo candida]|eukprot:CCI47491.1 unnamed protein product [Albugo candida]